MVLSFLYRCLEVFFELPGQGTGLTEHHESGCLAAVFVAIGTGVDTMILTVLYIGDPGTGGVEPGGTGLTFRPLELVEHGRLVTCCTRQVRQVSGLGPTGLTE
jgi:hypothetical protein